MRTVGIVLLIFITAFSQTKTRKVGTRSLKDEPAREIKEGNSQLRAKNYKAALTKFESALKHLESYNGRPNEELPEKYHNKNVLSEYTVMALYKSGKAAGGASNYAKADSYFQRAVKEGPEDTKAWYEFGDYLFDRNKVNEAKSALTNVVKIGETVLAKTSDKKEKAKIRRDMAQANYKLGRITSSSNPRKAAAYYKEAAELRENYYQPLLYLTKLHEEQKKWKDMLAAATQLEAVLKHKKTRKNVKRKQLPKATLLKGIAEYQLKKYKAATRTLAEISKMSRVKNSDKNASYYYIGLSYKKMNDKNKAMSFFKKTKGAFKKNAEYEIDDIVNGDRYTN